MTKRIIVVFIVFLVLITGGILSFRFTRQDQLTSSILPVKKDFVIAAVGDIACGPNDHGKSCQDEKTAELVRTINPDALLLLGDLQYQAGARQDFDKFFGANWKQFNPITYPTPGNHEYGTFEAEGYFDFYADFYMSKAIKNYYSFDIGPYWHIISLNSNCWATEGCLADTPQEKWLRKDLTDNPSLCTLAYWHHPFYTSGRKESLTAYRDFWKALYSNSADIVLNGHEHNYERFAPQDNLGNKNETKGIREFVVGTGGISLYAFQKIQPNSEFRDNKNFGVLKLALHESSYDWEFITIDNEVLDSGSDNCH